MIRIRVLIKMVETFSLSSWLKFRWDSEAIFMRKDISLHCKLTLTNNIVISYYKFFCSWVLTFSITELTIYTISFDFSVLMFFPLNNLRIQWKNFSLLLILGIRLNLPRKMLLIFFCFSCCNYLFCVCVCLC